MGDNRNFAALDWLIHEIGETLKEARLALEAYVENPKDAVRIRFCLTHIHQVYGSLQMVEFFGAAMLAEEMERLTQAMIQGTVSNTSEASEVLMRAILQFPVYLDQVKATRKDNPLMVLPLLNDLRSVRGESLFTDTKLFVPNLAPAKKIVGARIAATQDNTQFQSMVLKLRQMYQYAAAGFIRGVNSDENLSYLQKAFQRLQKLTQGTARFALWDICTALAEALEIDAIEMSSAVKNLLRQLDKEIKVLATHGNKALNSYTNDELIKNLLYYVARAGKHAPGFKPNSNLQRIYESYHLDEALIEGKEAADQSDLLSAPDADTLRSVVDALKMELELVKQALDACIAGNDTQSTLSESLPVIKRMADTMAVLGLGELRKQVLAEGAALEAISRSSQPLSHEQFVTFASKIVEIEQGFDRLVEQQSHASSQINSNEGDITLTRAKESVLRESRSGLENAKNAIIEYIASQWERQHLQQVPNILREIRGGLDIMPLPRAARVLGACARYIEDQLLSTDATPQWSSLDTLADAITSVEYYLERLSGGGSREENELLLSVAEESVASLGYAVGKAGNNDLGNVDFNHVRTLSPSEEIHTTHEAAEADEASLSAAYQEALDHDQDNALSVSALPVYTVEEEVDDISVAEHEEANESAAENIEQIYSTTFTPSHSVADTNVVEIAEEISVAEPVVNAQAAVTKSSASEMRFTDADDDIDEEIIEIFVEEAGEVLQAIAEYFPKWASNFEDQNSLTEFRRGFHTLKGSGRMVGAHDIGELSWSIENMLNRVIDNTYAPNHAHVTIIEKVRGILPGMIEAFKHHQPTPNPQLSNHYRELAEALGRGIVPEELITLAGAEAVVIDETAAHDEAATTETNIVEDNNYNLADANLNLADADHNVAAEISDDAGVDEMSVQEIYANAEIPGIELEEIDVADLAQVHEISDTENQAHELSEPAYELADDENLLAAESIHDNAQISIPVPEAEYLAGDDSTVDDDDAQLWDIFAAEAITHLATVQDFIDRMEMEAPVYEAPTDSMQRALHTLKGSAHMAEVTPIAELATPLEKFVKELRSYHLVINDDILQLLRDAVSYTQSVLQQIEHRQFLEIPKLQQFVARVQELREIHVAPLVRLQEMEENGKRPVDPELLSIFMAEEMNLLLDADKIIAQWQAEPNNLEILQPVLDELKKLTRGAQHAYLPVMANLGEKLEQVYEAIIHRPLACTPELCNGLNRAHTALLDMVDAVAAGQNLTDASSSVYEALDQLLNSSALDAQSFDQPLIANDELEVSVAAPVSDEQLAIADVEEIDLGEPLDLDAELAHADNDLSFESADESEEIIAALPEVNDELFEGDLLEEDLLDDDLLDKDLIENELIAEEKIAPTAATASAVNEEIDEEENLFIRDHAEESVASTTIHTAEISAPVHSEDEEFEAEIVEIFIEEADEILEDIERALHDWQEDWENPEPLEDLKRSLHTFKGGARLAGLTTLGDLSHNFETELIELDQARALDQAFFNHLNQYQDSLHAGVNVARARLNGEVPAPIPVAKPAPTPAKATAPVAPVSPVPIATSTPSSTTATNESVEIESLDDEEFDPDLIPMVTELARPTLVVDNSHHLEEGKAPADPSHKPNVLTFAPKPKPPAAPLPKVPGAEFATARSSGTQGGGNVQHLAARRAGPQEVVKVSAELLEELVNLAGETSISRGRMEQQVTDLSGAIDEMDATIHRMQEQLRRLDIETEAQVLFRQEQMQHEEFDPLEMDRYSQLQQLSRSLIESASDLMDLKYTLADKTRDTETLLLQQSRINTDLQEGLMRSRMVPFSRLVPRLRRIVRQAATELGKEVDFELDNVEGELDRTVLERMVAPLEHMLRNAVDHGIESPEERAAAGKPAVGRIYLSLGREGGDVLLRLSDDGKGINLKRVREKAIERGLMAEDAQLSDQDLMQFILHAGFSTADKVTQISGRGVGMDVVHSEIKQLGGAMMIDSTWGQGTNFIIRLPFTVSVNRALMVQIGDDLYAIPLNTIEGIVRVSPFELEHYYQDETARFDYAGENYQVRYLGTMLDSMSHPKLDGQTLPLPVVLVRSTEYTVALQVDRLLGSREIVVKTLGAQFAAVRGVSGATVMGDGSVVVILDLLALIRDQMALGLGRTVMIESSSHLEEEEQVEKTVLVVDDSVTVRKVTGRFLEREGFRVITAKDGVEAMQVLQEHIPDVMLLDIEMPRMDGFEVAKNIRTSSRLRHIPIIMITSRTGEKHRDHAFELGVNKYMGKPYQEDALLANIRELLHQKASVH